MSMDMLGSTHVSSLASQPASRLGSLLSSLLFAPLQSELWPSLFLFSRRALVS